MKKSTCGHFIHPMCVLFTPELTLDENGRANNIVKLDKERITLTCSKCNLLLPSNNSSNNSSRGNANVQCDYGKCFLAFHPYCAYKGIVIFLIRMFILFIIKYIIIDKKLMVIREYGSQEVGYGDFKYNVYCNEHGNKIDLKEDDILRVQNKILILHLNI
jgi:hypothetical protein